MKNSLTTFMIVTMSVVAWLPVAAQDTMIRRVQKEHGQTSPVIIWLLIAVIPVLFLIFAITKGKKSKKEVVNDTNKEERVVKNTLPKR